MKTSSLLRHADCNFKIRIDSTQKNGLMVAQDCVVDAAWNGESKGWVATIGDDEVPGMVTRADNFRTLMDEIKELLYEFAESACPEITIHIHSGSCAPLSKRPFAGNG